MAGTPTVHGSVYSVKALAERLDSSLKDLEKLSVEGSEIGVISLSIKRSLESLDPQVSGPLKLRYLLIHAYDQRESNPSSYELWLKILAEYGVPSYLVDQFTVGDLHSLEANRDTALTFNFTENHVSILTDILSPHSSKWYNLGLILNLPENVLTEIMSLFHVHGGVICLNRALREWIVGGHEHTKPPTVENLKAALRSNVVKLGSIANKLQEDLTRHGVSFASTPMLSNPPTIGVLQLEITRQSRDTEVAEGKSTLLEVQAATALKTTISYQWTKDNSPLSDGEFFFGSNKQILCIHNATLSSRGEYRCELKIHKSGEAIVVMSDPILLTVSLQPMVRSLVNRYRLSQKQGDSWPPMSRKGYIGLALIAHDEKLDELAHLAIEGDVDDFARKEENVEYKEAFGKYRKGHFILVEGRPGSGKTTLIQKVSKDWANGEPILEGAKLIFLITLRMLSKRRRISMSDILNLFYHNNKLALSVSEHLDEVDGEGVCFIIDGLDEYTSDEKDESIIFKIIRKEYLYQSMVIVASRPVAAAELRYHADSRVEVLGFLKQQIFEFIENYPFSSTTAAQKLSRFLNKHVNILYMCYLPVHVAMVCFLYDVVKEDLPNTETEMYKHFTMLTVLRALRRIDKSAKLSSIEDLDADQKEIFDKTCKLAFDLTCSSKQVFETDDLSSFCDLGSGAVPFLGLVTVDSTAGLYDYQDLYTFVHLTFQEYLAAYHLSKLDEDEQLKMLDAYGKEKHMQVVWKFYCGLASFADCESKFVAVLKGFDDSLFHCKCAFESQQKNTCECVVALDGKNGFHFENQLLNPSDFVCINHVIKNTAGIFLHLSLNGCNFGALDNLKPFADCLKLCRNLQNFSFSGTEVGDEGAEILASCLVKFNQLQMLKFCQTEIGTDGVRAIARSLRGCKNLTTLQLEGDFDSLEPESLSALGDSLKGFVKLKTIAVSRYLIGNDGAVALARGLENCTDLESFGLEWNRIGDDGIEALMRSLRNCIGLCSFGFEGNDMSLRGVHCLAESLERWIDLKSLNLRQNELNDDTIKVVFDSLKNCRKLQTVLLSANEVTDIGAKFIAEALEVCSALVTFDLHENKVCSNGVAAILAGLQNSRNLQSLNFGFNAIGNEGSAAIAESLKFWDGLESLDLNRVSISDEGAEVIANNLHYCSSLKSLDLSCNRIGSEGAKFIAEGLPKCKNIEVIYLQCNQLSDEGTTSLAECLKCCKSLKILNINDNKIGDVGAKALSESLPFCSSLEHFDISFNEIGDNGAEALAEGLKTCKHMQEIQLNSNKIGDDGVKFLVQSLKHCKTLIKLDIVQNKLGGGGAQVFAENIDVGTMDFSFCGIDDTSMESIAQDLADRSNLVSLFLENNQIGNEGAGLLGRALRVSSDLRELYLQKNNISEVGAKGLAIGLKCCVNIETLHLEHNPLGDEGIKSLAESLSDCSELWELFLQHAHIGDPGAEGLAQILKSCRRLGYANLQENFIGSSGGSFLGEGLRYCENLTVLNLNHNLLGDEGAACLAKGLKYCCNLVSLFLGKNLIGDDGAKDLSKFLKYLGDLQTLDLDDNKISGEGAASLAEGIKYCSDLEIFHVGNNHIGDGVKSLCKGLKHCSKLKEVDFGWNGISDKGTRGLAKCLKRCSHLEALYLRNNCIGDEGVKAITQYLSCWTNLQTLGIDQDELGPETILMLAENLVTCEMDFSCCKLDDGGTKALLDNLKKSSSVETFRFDSNSPGQGGLVSFAEKLISFSNLEGLSLQQNRIDDEGVASLTKGLKHCKKLHFLELSQNQIGCDGAASLGDLLALDTLYSMDLSCNNISITGAEMLSEGLKSCEKMTELDLSFNTISNDGAVVLAAGLEHCSHLHSLALDHNQIGDIGVKALASRLQQFRYFCELSLNYNEISREGAIFISTDIPHLKTLNLQHNCLGCDGIKALLWNLKETNHLEIVHLGLNTYGARGLSDIPLHCSTLKTLNLGYNRISKNGAKTLANGLKFCSSLSTLVLEHNKLSDDCMSALADGLKHCFRLQVLSLEYNQIADPGAKSLAVGLMHCHSLNNLSLQSNRIGDDGVIELVKGLKTCRYLEALNFNFNFITDAGAKVLAETLLSFNLKVLDIGGNSITNEGSRAFFNYPEQHVTIERLRVGNLEVASEEQKVHLTKRIRIIEDQQILELKHLQLNFSDITILSESFKRSRNLQILHLESCGIDRERMKMLAGGLECCVNLCILSLHMNQIRDEGAIILSSCLEKFKNLEELNLAQNMIGDEGAKVLAHSLRFCHKLLRFSLERNRLCKDSATVLVECFKDCVSLRELCLEDNSIGDEAIEILEDGFEHHKNLSLLLYDM